MTSFDLDHCHDVFVQLEDGIAYVADEGGAMNDPGGSGSLAPVAERHVLDVIHAAESCPGECIFIEVDAPGAQVAAPRIEVDATHEPVVVDDEAAA